MVIEIVESDIRQGRNEDFYRWIFLILEFNLIQILSYINVAINRLRVAHTKDITSTDWTNFFVWSPLIFKLFPFQISTAKYESNCKNN